MKSNTSSRVATLASTTAVLFNIGTAPVAASHDSLNCSIPDGLRPLVLLLHSLGELAFLAGITIGTIGFIIAGIFLMLPGEDWTRKGKTVAKNVFIGTILLLSANMIVSYLTVQVGSSTCA